MVIETFKIFGTSLKLLLFQRAFVDYAAFLHYFLHKSKLILTSRQPRTSDWLIIKFTRLRTSVGKAANTGSPSAFEQKRRKSDRINKEQLNASFPRSSKKEKDTKESDNFKKLS